MPILGNLSDFPLPEVLLLIGPRTGRLRLLDVPEFGMMEIDFSNGEVQSMHLGTETLTEAQPMIARLSVVVQSQTGMFEFRTLPVASVRREHPLMVNQLVMSLVCYVDQQTARESQADSPGHYYLLEQPQPEIWIEPELNVFFHLARAHLAVGVPVMELARRLDLDSTVTHQHVTNLHLLGLVRMVEMASVTPGGLETQKLEKISRQTVKFLRASRLSSEMQAITDRIPNITR